MTKSSVIIPVILAGGESSRMGRDKATLSWRGETLLDRQIRLGSRLSTEVWVSGRNYGKFSCVDKTPYSGPLGGIEACFEHIPYADWFLIYPVDTPLLSAESLFALRAAARSLDPFEKTRSECRRAHGLDDHLAIRFAGRCLPNLIRNSPTTRKIVEALLLSPRNRDRSIESLLQRLNPKTLPSPGPMEFLNINSPDDFKRLQENENREVQDSGQTKTVPPIVTNGGKWIVPLVFLFLWSVGCTTTATTSKPSAEVSPQKKVADLQPEVREPAIDLEGLKLALRMSRPTEKLGYAEKAFEDCGGQFGLPHRENCHQLFLVQIHFRIQCRDSEGTVSEQVTEDELAPLAHRRLQWTLRGIQGTTRSDDRGYAQILTLSPISQKLHRLKILSENDFLYLAAGEIKRVITPRNWCMTDEKTR